MTTVDERLPRMFLIDFHRAQIRGSVPHRWRAKDLGGLLFSAVDAEFTRRDLFNFIRAYTGEPLKLALAGNARLFRDSLRRARQLCRKEGKRLPGWLA
jgi:heptose I phosphotransferase